MAFLKLNGFSRVGYKVPTVCMDKRQQKPQSILRTAQPHVKIELVTHHLHSLQRKGNITFGTKRLNGTNPPQTRIASRFIHGSIENAIAVQSQLLQSPT